MGTTKRGSTLSITERLRRVFLPCVAFSGPRTVTVKVFDKHGLITEMMPSQDMVTQMQTFLNGLAATPGLPAAVVTNLSSIQFNVSYVDHAPSRDDIEHFAVTDFPMHLLTASGSVAASTEDVTDVLVNHRIPQKTNLVKQLDPVLLGKVLPYETLEEDWGNQRVLGIGIPGTYFIPNSQTRCRKVAVIKMQGFMTENLPDARRPAKILFALRHELGHMLGLRHLDGTIMNCKYDLSAPTAYSNHQIEIVSGSLQRLLQ